MSSTYFRSGLEDDAPVFEQLGQVLAAVIVRTADERQVVGRSTTLIESSCTKPISSTIAQSTDGVAA